jgi:hypothetical protein
VDLSPEHEYDLWREATLAAVPACSRHGLALAAHRRGFRVRLIGSSEGLPFHDRIRQRAPAYDLDGSLERPYDDRRSRTAAAGSRTRSGPSRSTTWRRRCGRARR